VGGKKRQQPQRGRERDYGLNSSRTGLRPKKGCQEIEKKSPKKTNKGGLDNRCRIGGKRGAPGGRRKKRNMRGKRKKVLNGGKQSLDRGGHKKRKVGTSDQRRKKNHGNDCLRKRKIEKAGQVALGKTNVGEREKEGCGVVTVRGGGWGPTGRVLSLGRTGFQFGEKTQTILKHLGGGDNARKKKRAGRTRKKKLFAKPKKPRPQGVGKTKSKTEGGNGVFAGGEEGGTAERPWQEVRRGEGLGK